MFTNFQNGLVFFFIHPTHSTFHQRGHCQGEGAEGEVSAGAGGHSLRPLLCLGQHRKDKPTNPKTFAKSVA